MPTLHRRQFLNVLLSLVSAVFLARNRISFASEIYPIDKTDEEWKKLLTPEQYRILRQHGTEYPNSSELTHEHRDGLYDCAACDFPLFSSQTKYDSGTGWPSFYASLPNAVATSSDHDLIFERTEVHCSQCGGHLGHVFNDGPAPTGKRFCMNGIALKFNIKKS